MVQKLLNKQKNPNQPNKNQIQIMIERETRHDRTNVPFECSSDTHVSLDRKNTYLFVERLKKDKDTDKDVDADRDSTGRPIVIGQPTGGHQRVLIVTCS